MSPSRTTRNAVLRIHKWTWAPLPFFFILILGLRIAAPPESHESLALLVTFDVIFAVACSWMSAHLFARRFLEQATPGWLLMGCGTAVWGVMSLAGIITAFPLDGQPEPDINLNVTVRNTCIWIAAFLHLAGAGFITITSKPLSSPRGWLIAGYVFVAASVGFVLLSTLCGWMPLFFIQGQGGTQVRQFVLSSAISMFMVAAMLVRPRPAQRFSVFARWYCYAMLFFALGLAASMADTTQGSYLCWSGRFALFFGSAYLLAAALLTARVTGTPKFHWESGIQKWRQDAVAIVLAMAAGVVRLAFLDELGTRAAYLTFFPAVVLASLYGGLRSGLVSATVSVGLALYFWVEPKGRFLMIDQADGLELAAFIVGSFITSWVAESMYRAHARAAAAEERARHADERLRTATELREAQEQRQRLMHDLSERVGELQAILDAVPVGVWIAHDPECRRMTGNACADRTIMKAARGDNVSASALPGEATVSYKVYHKGVELAPEELPAQVAARTGKPVDDMEIELLFADGRRIHLLSSAVPLFDSLGRVRGAINTGVDLAEIKKAEEARRITLDFLHLINRCKAPRELIRAAIAFFRDCSQCDAVGVRLKAGCDFPYYETWGFAPAFLEQERSLLLKDSEGSLVCNERGTARLACLCGKLLEIGENGPISRHSQWTNDAADLAARLSGETRLNLRGRCLTEGYRSIALIPMEQAGNPIGLIQLNAFEKGRFTPEQIALYEHLATQLSIALAKIQAEEELQKAHDELEQRVRDRTEALRRSTEILHIIAKNLPNGAIYQFERTADGHERYNYLSDGIRQLSGNPASGAPETPEMIHAMIHPDDMARVTEAEKESARALTPLDVQGRIRTKGGEIKWLHWHSAPRRLEDGGTLWDGIVVDITAIKESEAALQRANRALLVLKECDEALVRATEETELLHRVCSILVEVGSAKMAWVGFAENDEQKTVRPVASAGECGDYLETARIVWADVPRGRGPTGTAIRNRTATVSHSTKEDPTLEPWKARQQALSYAASIALPLIWENQCLGALMIYSPEADAFNPQENELLQQLAGDLAYGIMALRTRTERLQLQRDLLTISEREKQVISQELHDGLCQSLAGTAMMSYALQRRLAEGQNPEADCAKEIFGMLNTSVNEARNIAHGLHPVGPKPGGLMEALSQFSTSVSNLFEIDCTFQCPEPVLFENETVATHLFRITQEAVSNARKHGEAEKIVIRLCENAERIVLTIQDDGIGIPDNPPQKRGLGLNTMSHRANQIGAALTIQRAGAGGTIVRCEAPKKALNSRRTPANG